MIALHYRVTLPRDYDMSVIHRRIEAGGPAMDGHEGLVFKAFLTREAGVDEAPANEYAPLYVWANTSRMTQFLTDPDGFGRIQRDFGAVPVSVWPVVSLHLNRAAMETAEHATVIETAADAGAALSERAAEMKSSANAEIKHKGVAMALRAVDLEGGREIAASAGAGRNRRGYGIGYRVGHVSFGPTV